MARGLIGSASRGRTFASLHYPNYRLLWIGNLVSHTGDWMDQIAFNWLILELTGSPFYLGLVNLCRAVPILIFALIGGVAADRVERRRLMMATQSFAMLLALALAVLVSTGQVQVWQVFVVAALRGTMMSFNLPARQTLISDIVPRSDLPNAIALNSTTMNLTRIIGPSIAGVLISVIGVAGCFYLNALSFVAVLWTLQKMVIPTFVRKPDSPGMLESLRDGINYVRGNHPIAFLVALAVVPMFFGQPYITMLAVFARDVLDIGPTGLGLLTSASGLGAVIGTLMLASAGASVSRVKVMLLAMTVFGVLLVAFSFSGWPLLSILLVMGVGAMNASYNASNNTLLQMSVPSEYRGRVLSILFINRGLVPLGTALAGTLSTVVGAQMAVGSMGAVVAVMGILAIARAPASWRVGPEP